MRTGWHMDREDGDRWTVVNDLEPRYVARLLLVLLALIAVAGLVWTGR